MKVNICCGSEMLGSRQFHREPWHDYFGEPTFRSVYTAKDVPSAMGDGGAYKLLIKVQEALGAGARRWHPQKRTPVGFLYSL